MKKSIYVSFEFFPPKTEQGLKNLHEAVTQLTKQNPLFFSVTFGAGGSTRQGTIDSVLLIKNKTNVAVAPHLSCIGSKKEEILEILDHYKKMNVKRIVALRGDLPSGMGQTGELRYANELVELIRKNSGDYFHIEVAAYPEFHPQAKNAVDDIYNFKRKIEAGANSAITQYFFNPDAYFHFVETCAKLNLFIPIIPGIMPITQFSKLMRFSEVCGAEIPRWIRKKLEAYGDDHESIQLFGLEVVYNLCEKLIAGGAPGLHFYTLNHHEASIALLKKLNLNTLKPMKV